MRDLRVLAIINALGEGGSERSLAASMGPLRERGVDVSVAILRSRGDEGVEPSLRARGYDIVQLPSGRARYGAFRRLIRERQPDVVHSMLYEANLTARVATAGLRPRPRVLTSLVNTSYGPARLATPGTDVRKVRAVQALDLVTGRLLVDRFHAVSRTVADDAARTLRIPRSKLTVVPRGREAPAVDPLARERLRAEWRADATSTVLVNVGRHEHQKDHVTLVRAFGRLVDGPAREVHLVIAGREGNATAELHRAIESLAAPERVHLLGHRSDIPDVLSAADLFVFPSRYEGMPGAVIEAMSVGLPVVASDIGPVREVVDVGPTGNARLAPAGDAVALAETIDAVLADRAWCRAAADRSRARFEERFTIERSAEGMAALYHSMISPTSAANEGS